MQSRENSAVRKAFSGGTASGTLVDAKWRAVRVVWRHRVVVGSDGTAVSAIALTVAPLSVAPLNYCRCCRRQLWRAVRINRGALEVVFVGGGVLVVSAGGSILSDVVLGSGAGVGVDVLFGTTSGTVVSSADPRGLVRWHRERHRGEQRRHRDHLSVAAAMSGAGLAAALRPHRRAGSSQSAEVRVATGDTVFTGSQVVSAALRATHGRLRRHGERRDDVRHRAVVVNSAARRFRPIANVEFIDEMVPGVRLRTPQSKNVGKPLADHSIS
jgi:hypothetical protein